MYVKLFNQILDSSIADNRKLRHFFTDLLLCSDPDGNVVMTKQAISSRIRCPVEEVEWGISELEKPEEHSFHDEYDGRRIIPLEGHGYGWKIVNYSRYRDYKTAKQMRDETAARVRRHREKKKKSKPISATAEPAFTKAIERGDEQSANSIIEEERDTRASCRAVKLPKQLQ